MKITVGIQNMALYPENDAEVHQLEWVAQQIKKLNKKCHDTRQWNITSLSIPLQEVRVSLPLNAEELARIFHVTYEKLAPSFGYETRKETREFENTSPNGKLMIAVCGELIKKGLCGI